MSKLWVLLMYTLPREPTAPRVAVWRKLKKLGALRVHDAAWVLPATPALLEQVRWLAVEIREARGEAFVWHASGDEVEQDDVLIEQFMAQADVAYRAILAALLQPGAAYADLARRYRRVQAIDYFHAPSGGAVRAQLAEGRVKHEMGDVE